MSGKERRTNVVKLKGRIVNRYETDQVVIVTLAIKEYAKKKKEDYVHFPKIYFFKSDHTGVDKYFLHDEVVVTGHLVAPVKRRPNGTTFVSQAIIGESIRLFGRETMPDGTVEQRKDYPMNIAFLCGEVQRIEQKDYGFIYIYMNAVNGAHNNRIFLTARNKDYLLLSPGDIIDVRAKIMTSVTQKPDGPKRYRQNVVPFSITKIEYKTGEEVEENPEEKPKAEESTETPVSE